MRLRLMDLVGGVCGEVGDLVMAAQLDQRVLQGLVDRSWGRVLMGHPALAGCGLGKACEHAGDLWFWQAYLLATVVAEHRLMALGRRRSSTVPSRRRQGSFQVAGRLGVAGVGEAPRRELVFRVKEVVVAGQRLAAGAGSGLR